VVAAPAIDSYDHDGTRDSEVMGRTLAKRTRKSGVVYLRGYAKSAIIDIYTG
jgi:hypothetical protein